MFKEVFYDRVFRIINYNEVGKYGGLPHCTTWSIEGWIRDNYIKMSLSEWKEYYPNLRNANKSQKEYYKLVEKAINSEEVIAIEVSLSYVFVFLYKAINRFIRHQDINALVKSFDSVRKLFKEYDSIVFYSHRWQADAHLWVKNYDKAWFHFAKCDFGFLEDMIYFSSKRSNTFLTSKDIFKIISVSNSGLTTFGKNNYDQVSKLVSIFLKDFHFENGSNFLEYFIKKYDYLNITEEQLKVIKILLKPDLFDIGSKQYLDYQQNSDAHSRYYFLFNGAQLDSSETPYIITPNIPGIILYAIHARFKVIVREAENTLREEMGIPRVGEGWVNETELYYHIANAFKEERVVHHGRPAWLKRQHLDIYI